MMSFTFLIKRFLVVFMLEVTICFCSCSKDRLTGKEYQGYYYTCERISLEFESNSKVVANISSTDFVGHFSDLVYGHYDYDHPNVMITWTGVDSDNDAYKEVMLNPDSIIINESLDTLRLYEKAKEFVLPRSHLYQIDKNAPFLEQVGQYCYQSILIVIIFIIKHFFSIIVAIIILAYFMKWRKKRKNNSGNK